VAALGHMFGFLIGRVIGGVIGSTTGKGDLSPIYLFLVDGIVVVGLGVAAVLHGARRVTRDRHATFAT